MANHDHNQQTIPGLDLSWLRDCANDLLDHRQDVDHLRHMAEIDDLVELRDALAIVCEKMLAAERITIALAKKHGHYRGIVGDTRRGEIDARTPVKSEETATKSDKPCRKCGAFNVWVEEIGDNPDYSITCRTCKHHYCVDGSDG